MISGVTDHLMSIDFITPQIGWAVGWNARVLYTNDAGLSWNPITVPLGQSDFWSVRFINNRIGWIMGGLGITLFTDNGGYSWKPWRNATSSDIYNCFFNSQNLGWAVGKNGTILKFTGTPTYLNPELSKYKANSSFAFYDAQSQRIVIDGFNKKPNQITLVFTEGKIQKISDIQDIGNGRWATTYPLNVGIYRVLIEGKSYSLAVTP
jgi:hypothetical protein